VKQGIQGSQYGACRDSLGSPPGFLKLLGVDPLPRPNLGVAENLWPVPIDPQGKEEGVEAAARIGRGLPAAQKPTGSELAVSEVNSDLFGALSPGGSFGSFDGLACAVLGIDAPPGKAPVCRLKAKSLSPPNHQHLALVFKEKNSRKSNH